MRARDHALGGAFGGETRAQRKAAADPLGDRHDVGSDADLLMIEHRAGPAITALHLVQHQQQPVLVARGAQPPQERVGADRHAALTLDRLDQEPGGMLVDQRQRGV